MDNFLVCALLAIFTFGRQITDCEGKRWESYKILWPGAIVPYKVSKSVQFVDSKGVLAKTIDEIEQNTCIRFVPRTTEVDFVDITAGLDCVTPIGRQGKTQVLALQIPFCLERKKLLRQLLHVLGLPNEQLRPDRDDYVKISWENVSLLNIRFFTKMNSTEVQLPYEDLPYDYNSVLHADANFHGANSTLPTIIPIREGVTLGKAEGLSEVDIKKLNILYC